MKPPFVRNPSQNSAQVSLTTAVNLVDNTVKHIEEITMKKLDLPEELVYMHKLYLDLMDEERDAGYIHTNGFGFVLDGSNEDGLGRKFTTTVTFRPTYDKRDVPDQQDMFITAKIRPSDGSFVEMNDMHERYVKFMNVTNKEFGINTRPKGWRQFNVGMKSRGYQLVRMRIDGNRNLKRQFWVDVILTEV